MQNRQSGRRRRGGGGGNGNNPRPMGMAAGGQNAARLEVRVRGNAHQLLEKYKQLARDAHQAGDRVAAEYYLQHSDHYFRVLNDSRIRQEEMRARRGVFDQFEDEPAGSDDDGQDGGQDGGDEQPEAAERPRQQPRNDGDRGERRPRFDRDRDRGERDRGERDRGDRGDGQDGGERPERAERADRPERAERQDRGDRPERGNRWQERRPERADAPRQREERDGNRVAPAAAEQGLSDGEAALVAFGGAPARAEPAVDADADAGDGEAPKPRRRGRPRKVEAEPAEG
jgi:hypothetical protein